MLDARRPLFGICFGNQILGRALGLGTYKLRFGHRGLNQPVLDRVSGTVRVTSHNHGFAVDAPLDRPTDTPYGPVEVSHVGLNDDVVEGLRCLEVPAFSVQFHPESAAGPHDAAPLFQRFVDLMEPTRGRGAVPRCGRRPATDIEHVMVIGSGPIIIGQASEFDYSGTQACRVLKAEGLRVSLVNSNPATIMTDPEVADATYIEPLTPEFVEKVIAKERPDALLATLGGQTALNIAIGLYENGVLEKYGVQLIGADVDAINRGEDRQMFKDIVRSIGADAPRSTVCGTVEEALATAEEVGYPVVIRPSFTMGGLGSGIATDEPMLRRMAAPRPGRLPGAHRPHRGVGARLEGVRARADARPQRQRGRHLLDREHRRDGRAHRRLGDRRPGDDAHRPRVPADARRRHRRAARGRRRHRRLQHPVRRPPGDRPPRRHRDEPAGVPVAARWRRRPPASRSPRSPRSSPSATPSTRSPTTSPASPRRRSSRRWTTSSSRSRGSPSRSSPAPTRG